MKENISSFKVIFYKIKFTKSFKTMTFIRSFILFYKSLTEFLMFDRSIPYNDDRVELKR